MNTNFSKFPDSLNKELFQKIQSNNQKKQANAINLVDLATYKKPPVQVPRPIQAASANVKNVQQNIALELKEHIKRNASVNKKPIAPTNSRVPGNLVLDNNALKFQVPLKPVGQKICTEELNIPRNIPQPQLSVLPPQSSHKLQESSHQWQAVKNPSSQSPKDKLPQIDLIDVQPAVRAPVETSFAAEAKKLLGELLAGKSPNKAEKKTPGRIDMSKFKNLLGPKPLEEKDAIELTNKETPPPSPLPPKAISKKPVDLTPKRENLSQDETYQTLQKAMEARRKLLTGKN